MVKTANGFKKIEDWSLDLVPIQLRTILQEHRATLIDKLIGGGLDTYIDYKFKTRISIRKIEELKLSLENLRNSGIDINKYAIVFDMVLNNEFTSLDNSLFYGEIDSNIRSHIFEPHFFPQGKQIFS